MWLGEMGRLPVGQSRPSIIYFRPGPLVYLNAPSGVIILRLKRPMVKGLFRSCLVADLSMAIIGLSLATGPTKAGWPFQFGPSLGSRIHRKMILKRFAETMPNLLQEYRDDGYFIVDDAVEKDLLEELGQALRRAADKVRSGAVVEHAGAISTMGKYCPYMTTGVMPSRPMIRQLPTSVGEAETKERKWHWQCASDPCYHRLRKTCESDHRQGR